MSDVFWGVQLESSKLVIFDVDGTLNQTERYAIDAYRKALTEIGKTNYTDAELRARIGAPFEEDILYFLGDQKETLGNQFLDSITKYWIEGIKRKATTYPGVTEMLETLKQKGYQLAICSNAYPQELETILDTLKIGDQFCYIQGLTEEGTKKDSLRVLLKTCKPKWAVMVGDRNYDCEAAEANNIGFIGCLYGYCMPGELNHCKYLTSSAYEIPDLTVRLEQNG